MKIQYASINDETEARSVEISPNITAEVNEARELIGIEIIKASAFIRDSILESAPARLLMVSRD